MKKYRYSQKINKKEALVYKMCQNKAYETKFIYQLIHFSSHFIAAVIYKVDGTILIEGTLNPLSYSSMTFAYITEGCTI